LIPDSIGLTSTPVKAKQTANPIRPPRLTFLMGKGGVGRSTVAAAMGLALSRRGLRTLVVETSARQAVPAMFERRAAGYDPVECAPGLHCLRVTWEDALREYGVMKLRFRALYRLVFENPFVRRLLPAVPGVPEILVIGKIAYCATDGVPGIGTPDAVVVDAPATGHGLSLVTAPAVVADTVPAGPLAEDARRLRAVLLDSAFTRFHIVTTPEEMPVSEGIDLHGELSLRHGLPFGPVIVNAFQDLALPGQEREMARLAAASSSAPRGVLAAVQAALFMDARHRAQTAHLDRLKTVVPLPVVRLPEVPGAAGGRVKGLADHIDAVLWREAR